MEVGKEIEGVYNGDVNNGIREVSGSSEDGPAAVQKLLALMTPRQLNRLVSWLEMVKAHKFGQVNITVHDGEIHMVQALLSEKISRLASRKS